MDIEIVDLSLKHDDSQYFCMITRGLKTIVIMNIIIMIVNMAII